jgi:hypothetical protein
MMNNAEQALQDWIKTQSLPVSDVEEHGFINGYNWALKEKRPNNVVLVPCNKLAEMQAEIVKLKLDWQCMATELEKYHLLYGAK